MARDRQTRNGLAVRLWVAVTLIAVAASLAVTGAPAVASPDELGASTPKSVVSASVASARKGARAPRIRPSAPAPDQALKATGRLKPKAETASGAPTSSRQALGEGRKLQDQQEGAIQVHCHCTGNARG